MILGGRGGEAPAEPNVFCGSAGASPSQNAFYGSAHYQDAFRGSEPRPPERSTENMTKYRIIAVACIATAILCRFGHSTTNSNAANETHRYKISLRGTEGVQLRMLLVTKRDAEDPPSRKSEVVTAPFETSFDANSFYVWFDTLENGLSGNDGSRITAEYSIDGRRQGGGFGMTIKRSNSKTGSFGNL